MIYHYSKHCVRSVHIRSFTGPYFPAFGLNTEIYEVEKNDNAAKPIEILCFIVTCNVLRLEGFLASVNSVMLA